VAVIAVTGRKGGVGKTTLTGNLAVELLALGRSILVLDADPQQSLVSWAGLGDGVLRDVVRPIEVSQPAEFRRAVAKAAKQVDRVIIDTPPGFADPALLAALVSDLVLLPAGPSPLDLMAVRDAMEVARQARKERGGERPLIRFVPSKVTSRTRMSADLSGTLADMGEAVLPAIGLRTVVAEATLAGLSVREFAKSSAATDEFEALAAAIEELL
jgi:chromosome partitioning protein